MVLGWGDDGSQGDRPGSGTMANGGQGLAAPYDSGAHAPGAGALVGHAVAGPRVDQGGGAGPGSSHHRRWAAAFGEGGPRALILEQTGGSPRP